MLCQLISSFKLSVKLTLSTGVLVAGMLFLWEGHNRENFYTKINLLEPQPPRVRHFEEKGSASPTRMCSVIDPPGVSLLINLYHADCRRVKLLANIPANTKRIGMF